MDNVVGAIRGGEVATEYGTFKADLVIHDGRIVSLCEDASDVVGACIDASGLTIFPGGIDMHTHLREPSAVEREGFSYGTASAAAGGITTVIEMPQADPLVATVDTFRYKRDLASRGSITDFGLYAAATGQSLEDLQALQAEGALAFKAFLCDSSPGYPRLNDGLLMECLFHLRKLDALLVVHAENNDLLQKGIQRMQMEGRTDPAAHAESRPPFVEIEAIRRVVEFARQTGTRLHIAHVSTADGVQAVLDARVRGLNVTCETCPQYLLMDLSDLDRLGPFARCAPALRERKEVEALWQAVLSEHVNVLASDHSPYRLEEKECGNPDIFQAKLGLNIIQSMLPAVLDEGVHRRGMTYTAFANISASNPSRILGLYPQKGSIRVGADADLTLWDMNSVWDIRREELFSRHPWTPLEGRRVTGRVVTTIRRGEVIYQNGTVVGKPGDGHFLGRSTVRPSVSARINS